MSVIDKIRAQARVADLEYLRPVGIVLGPDEAQELRSEALRFIGLQEPDLEVTGETEELLAQHFLGLPIRVVAVSVVTLEFKNDVRTVNRLQQLARLADG